MIRLSLSSGNLGPHILAPTGFPLQSAQHTCLGSDWATARTKGSLESLERKRQDKQVWVKI